MQKSRIRELCRDSDQLVIVIETIHIRQHRTNKTCSIRVLLEPTEIVICVPEHIYALNSDAQPIAIERLRRKIPELDAAIKAWVHC